MDAPDTKSLPENAYEPLEPGETYGRSCPPKPMPEVTGRSWLGGSRCASSSPWPRPTRASRSAR